MMLAAEVKPGQTLRTVSGVAMTVVAHVPAAKLEHQLVTVDAEGEIHTYWPDGKFSLDRQPCGLDLLG
jgi:hypothetical protein